MNEEITGVKPPMGFPHIKDLSGSEATILQVANSQGDILGYATLDDIDAYIEQKVSETVHSFSQKQIFQDVTINGTFDGSNVVNQSKLNGALGSYYNKQSVEQLLNGYTEKGTSTISDFNEIIPTQIISTRFDIGFSAQNMPAESGTWVIQTSRRINNLVQIAKRMSSTLTPSIYTRSGTLSNNIVTWEKWEKITTETDVNNILTAYQNIKEISFQSYNGVNMVVGLADITDWWNGTGIDRTVGFNGHIFGSRNSVGGVYSCNCNIVALVNDKKGSTAYQSLLANNLGTVTCIPCIFTYEGRQYLGFKHRANRDYLELAGDFKGLLDTFVVIQESNVTIEVSA